MAGLGVVRKKQELLSIDDVVKMFPDKKKTINKQTVDLINSSVQDIEFDGYSFKNTLAEYSNIMKRRSGSLNEYICAVKFVAYVESGDNTVAAYRKAFAHRKLVQDAVGKSSETNEYIKLSRSATRYSKTPMVVDIMTIADVPLYILYKSTKMQAVGVLADEMVNAALPKDRIMAATAILKEIKEPEKVDMELKVGLNEDAAKQIDQTNKQLYDIAENQRMLLESGLSIEEIQTVHIKKEEEIIEGEIDE